MLNPAGIGALFRPWSFRQSLLFLCLLALLSSVCPANGEEQDLAGGMPRVLVLNSYHFGYNWSDGEMRGVLHSLVSQYPGIVPEVEFMDWRRHPDMGRGDLLIAALRRKHELSSFNLIIALDDPAFEFVLKYRKEFGATTPVVFGGVNYFASSMLAGHQGVTGFEQTYDVPGSLELMSRLHPRAKNVLVVHCNTESGQAIRHQVERAAPAYASRFRFEYYTNWSASELLERVGKLDHSWLVLLLSMYRDRTGQVLTDDPAFGAALPEKSTVPIYFFAPPIETHFKGEGWSHAVWQGIGGSLMSSEAHGEQIGQLACRILKGESPDSIPVSTTALSHLAMNYRQMLRFGIKVSQLPPETAIYFGPLSAYEHYRWQMLLQLALIGVLSGAVIVLLIVQFRRRGEVKNLRDSSERNHLLARATKDLVWDWNPATGAFWWNDNYRSFMGAGAGAEPSLDAWKQHIAAQDRERVWLDLRRCIDETATQWRSEYHFNKPEGGEGIMFSRVHILRDDHGKATRVVGTMIDVTERRKLEWERTRLATAFSQSSDLLAVLGTDGTIIHVNPAFQSITGFERHETIGRSHDFVQKSGLNGMAFAEIASRVASTGAWTRKLECQRKGGGLYTLYVTITAIHGGSSYAEGYLLVGRDVTRELRQEEQTRLSQKMEAVGLLAGGVAHDFNNLLQVINGYVQILSERELSETERLDSSAQIANAAKRASQLTRQLMLFSRKQTMEESDLDLGSLVAEVLKGLRRSLGEGIVVEFQQRTALCGMKGDKSQIEQVIFHLCTNARDAMANGGRLSVSVDHVQLSDGFCELQPWARAGDYVVLEVSDTGCGMDKETQSRIYEPFFTTKPKEKGQGLGLPIVYGIVSRHGGLIHVYSEPGLGSNFRVYFPANDDAQPSAAKAVEELAVPTGAGVVLFAEDDPSVRKLVQHLLEQSGYELIIAEDGGEAVDLFLKNKQRIDLVMLDAVMPKHNGREVYARIAAERPELPVLFSSGYGSEMIHPEPMQTPLCQMIQKPYDTELLLKKISQMLKDSRF